MKKFLKQNGILLIAIAVLTALILGMVSTLFGFDPLANVLGTLASPFRAVATSISHWVEDRYSYAFNYDKLLEENALLKERVAELEKEIYAAEDSNRENELLRELTRLAEKRSDFEFVDVSISILSNSNWSSSFTIDKGSNSDISVNDCVVDAYGNLVGIVREVGFNYAVVNTLIDPTTEMGGRLIRTDDNAVLEGDFTLMKENRLKLTFLPEISEPLPGDPVVTSNLGDTFPAGLVVGTIESLHTEANGLGRYAVVVPSTDLSSLRYVFVIKDFNVVS